MVKVCHCTVAYVSAVKTSVGIMPTEVEQSSPPIVNNSDEIIFHNRLLSLKINIRLCAESTEHKHVLLKGVFSHMCT